MRLGPWIDDSVLSASVRVERAAKLRPDCSECGAVWRIVALTDGVWWRGEPTTRREALIRGEMLVIARGGQ
jgi:hypothetical protein